MSEDHKNMPSDRIPYEALTEAVPVSRWHLPPMAKNGASVSRTAKKKGKASPDEEIEVLPKNKKPKQLTADELQQITEEARREGFQQGLIEGTEQGIREGTKVGEKSGNQRAYLEAKKDIETLQSELRQMVTRLFDPMQQQERVLENLVVDIALNLAKRIVADELSAKPEQLIRIVEDVVSCIPQGAKNICVYLNEHDAARLQALLPPSAENWRIIVDNRLSVGGCKVVSDSSTADFSVEERLATFFDKINDVGEGVDKHCSALPDYHEPPPHEQPDGDTDETL